MPAGVRPDNPLRATHAVSAYVTEIAVTVADGDRSALIALIDRIRMLDNDLIRLNQKLNMILELDSKARENLKKAEEKEKAKEQGAKKKDELSK